MDPISNVVVILFMVVIPLVFLLLQVVLSSRKKVILSAIIPALWTLLGAWVVITRFVRDDVFSSSMCIFFVGGDIILIGITILVRYLKRKKSNK